VSSLLHSKRMSYDVAVNHANYKQRKITLTPRRCEDGTWRCTYRIFEFRSTCWGYHKGCPDGSFASLQAAAAVSLKEAKRIIDSLDVPA